LKLVLAFLSGLRREMHYPDCTFFVPFVFLVVRFGMAS